MKLIFSLWLFLMISAFSVAQERDKNKSKEKKEKNSHAKHQDDDGEDDDDEDDDDDRRGDDDGKIKKHEQIIWAGTGIKVYNKSKDLKKVPPPVLNSFRQLFPDQKIDNVISYRGLYAITFSNAVYTTTLIYRADGTFVEARTVATESIVPALVKEKVKQFKRDYSSEIVMIEKPNKQKFYRYRMKKTDDDDEYVVFNESGERVTYDY